ncbi:Nse4-domain-containing protein [Bimuria novae-zelandiae CBS 107.79]|uniref:Non-structural maintenance of chromosomes element 4 n=1 Tax=Bimuria novae-zelandiae CBS 107.79 TaxID=1447943 RepID=A0A6A5UH31_9PLEO|nr:Nse4-domain-containing protein [Bimuria novae-zelandiae CBS 107.79]
MARLNAHPSATPLQSRATTVDTLYRDLTPAAASSRVRQSTTYSVISPGPSQASDKENHIPESRDFTPQPRPKRKLPAAGARVQRLPTPELAESANPSKRRKTNNTVIGQLVDEEGTAYEDEEDAGVGGYAQDEDEGRQSLPTPVDAETDGFTPLGENDAEEQLPTPDDAEDNDDEDPVLRNYNPDQKPEKRRAIKSGFRNLQREVDENRDDYVKPDNNRLSEIIPLATGLFGKVRMTDDAVLDSHLLTTVTDLSGKKLKNSLEQGSHGIGIDLDQFVSRCIFFMKEGRPPGADEDAQPSNRGPRQTHHDEDDEEIGGEGLDWAFLGRRACFPSNKRPPLSSFLLGPLSLQRRVRPVRSTTTATGRASQRNAALGPATRPQEIDIDELQKNENSSLTHHVQVVKTRLSDHLESAFEALAKIEVETEEDWKAACKQHRVCPTTDSEPAVSLFEFAVNPHDFGQTVENLFYISFLIREGAAKVEMDENGLPLLAPQASRDFAERREQNVEKRQAIFSIDYATWNMLKEAFDITTPLIPHRDLEATTVSTGSWTY